MIAREGWPFVLVPAFAGVVLTIFGEPYVGWALVGLAGLALMLYRDPVRSCCGSTEAVCAPVDGRVMPLENASEKTVSRGLRIAASWRDAAVLRAPMAGTLEQLEHRPRTCESLWRTKEGALTLLVRGRGPVRPLLRPGRGDEVARGERIGLLPLGGRVELRLPKAAQPVVAAGDRVRAGHSVVAEIDRTEVP